MTAFISSAPGLHASPHRHLQFGSESGSADGSVQWLLKRNCALAPRQLLTFYASLCAASLAIAGVFWSHGAVLVMPFAGIEMLGVGSALLLYARHAADSELIVWTAIACVGVSIVVHGVTAAPLSRRWLPAGATRWASSG